jgi:hypothetical protein
MTLDEFIIYYSINGSKMMWLLGAGTSRSSGMPSASDIIWDLKRKYYCLKQQQTITDNELSNEAVKTKIQNYLEAEGNPPLWSDNEYAHYFQLVFADNLQLQQNYLSGMLATSKISINSGYRILSALIAIEHVKILFTTNFDSVLENAFSLVAGKELHSYALEGSSAALNALNDERFPLYIKMHGDFRYQEMKNLPENLRENNKEVEQAFVNACSRYGLVVSGYSGRDENVIAAFEKAIDTNNPFPKGLFWMTSVQGHVFPRVTALIAKAQAKGITAHIIESDTFDSLLGRIWKQLGNTEEKYNTKIRRAIYSEPKVDRYSGSLKYPLIRTNAFHIEKMPTECLVIIPKQPITLADLKIKFQDAHSSALITCERDLYAWGPIEEIYKVIPKEEILETKIESIADNLARFRSDSLFNSFVTKALVRSLSYGRPLRVMQRHQKYYLVVSSKDLEFKTYEPLLKNALRSWDFNLKKFVPAKSLVGKVPGMEGVFWMECVEISLEYIDGKFWLLLNPDIWIEPRDSRRSSVDFLDRKKLKRYNNVQNDLLNAWKQLLFGMADVSLVSPYATYIENKPIFEIRTTTAYSFRS